MDLNPETIVLYVDEAVLVVNKPFGLLSIRDGYNPSLPHLSSVMEPLFGKIWMVHRLDRDTSGVLVMARSADAHRSLNAQFQNRSVAKSYKALITGSPPWTEKEVVLPLRRDGDRRHRTVIDFEHGRTASTDFSVLERYGNYSLVIARPSTGYTHQIRAHLAFLGFPIAFDTLYGNTHPQSEIQAAQSAGPTALSRLALHASTLTFDHPLTNQRQTYEAPLPEDFDLAIQLLRQSIGSQTQ